MRASAVLLAVLVAGCNAVDPCDGLAGTCISARVEGPLMGLDGLLVSVAVAQTPQMMTSTPGGRFELPVRLAILLPPTATSPVTMGVDALANGQDVGSSGPVSVAFTPNAKTAVTFVVHALGGGDGGNDSGGDGSVGDAMPDGPPPGVVSFVPSSIDYGTIDRGTMSPTHVITLYNNTTHAVMTTSTPMPTGDAMLFNIDTSKTTCFGGAGMNVQLMLPAGGSCTIGFIFAPQKAGDFMMDVQATFDDGESAGFSLTGHARPVWSAENVSGLPSLTAVWGSSDGDLWAVGNGPTAEHSTGNGIWQPMNSGINAALNAVWGVDAQHIWAGGAGGNVFFGTGGNAWSSQVAASCTVRGLWMRDVNTGFGATDCGGNGQITRFSGGTWTNTLISNAPNPFLAVCGFGQRNVAVGYSAQFYSTDANGGSWSSSSGLFTGYTGHLRGCWLSDLNTVWVVGDAGTGIIGIYRCVANGANWTCTHETAGPMTQNLSAVSGRVTATAGVLDLYAVGPLGNMLLHSDGTGTWTPVTLPNNQAMNGVWVSPTGTVVAVGFNGEINHYY